MGTGLHPRPGSSDALKAYFPHIATEWTSTWIPPRKGENVDELHQRCESFLQAFIPRIEAARPTDRCVLLVTHAATAIALTRVLTGHRDLPLRVGCCTVTVLHRVPTTEGIYGQWHPADQGLASGAHLADGSLRDWGFEDEVVDNEILASPGELNTEGQLDDCHGLQVSQPCSNDASNVKDGLLPSRM